MMLGRSLHPVIDARQRVKLLWYTSSPLCNAASREPRWLLVSQLERTSRMMSQLHDGHRYSLSLDVVLCCTYLGNIPPTNFPIAVPCAGHHGSNCPPIIPAIASHTITLWATTLLKHYRAPKTAPEPQPKHTKRPPSAKHFPT